MWVLFDQGTPVPLAQFLVGHTVSTSAREGVEPISKQQSAGNSGNVLPFVFSPHQTSSQEEMSGRSLDNQKSLCPVALIPFATSPSKKMAKLQWLS
jgi:hypothetical protein